MLKKISIFFLLFYSSSFNYCDDLSHHTNKTTIATAEKSSDFKAISKKIQEGIVLMLSTYSLYLHFTESEESITDIEAPSIELTTNLRLFLFITFGYVAASTMKLGVSQAFGDNACISGNQIIIGKDLLDNYSDKALRFVVGHEMGHYYNPRGSLARYILRYQPFFITGLSLVSGQLLTHCDTLLEKAQDRYPQSQYPFPSQCITAYLSVRKFCNDNPLISYIIEKCCMMYLLNVYSQYKEKEADLFSLEKTGAYEGAIEYFSKEHTKIMNYSLAGRLRYYITLPFSTHPSAAARIKYITHHWKNVMKR